MIIKLYGSLEQYISRIRNNIEEYEGIAIQICGETQCKKDKRRKRQFDETINEVITETGKEDFRINIFFVLLDKLNS